MTEQPYYLKH